MTADQIAAQVEAAMTRGCVSRQLTIAGTGIDLELADAAADSVLPPFEHLISREQRQTALTISIASLESGELEGLPDSGVVSSSGTTVIHLHRQSAAVFERASGCIRALVRTGDGVASWIRAKPLQVPLSIFFADRGIDLVHGGLVSLGGNGVLIAGNSGAGKSTLAIASVAAGLDFLGDDCVAVSGTTGYSVFGSGALDVGDAAKVVLPIGRMFAGRLATETNIRGIVLPRITGGEGVTLQRASGAEALLALAPGSIVKRAVPAAETMARMATLARTLPAFRLEMGPIGEAAARVAALLEELAA